MFDIGFWELVLIAIMGLVILGPDRLPVAIRTLRSWITGVRKFSDTVKSELTEELRVHELHTNLKKAEQSNLQNLSPEVAESLRTLQEAAASVTEPFKNAKEPELNHHATSSSVYDVEDNAINDSTPPADHHSAETSVNTSENTSENIASDKP